MRGTLMLVVVVAACGSKKEAAPRASAGSGSASTLSVAAAPDAASVAADAPAVAVEVDAAAAPAEPPVKTGIELVSFEGIKQDALGEKAQMWLAWIETHFTKCEIDEKVEPVTTTVTIAFKGDAITYDLPKVPDALAACIKKNIETPYLGYEPTPPASLGKTTLRVKIKIAEKEPAPPPDTSPVKFVASKISGARDRKALDAWIDANVARKLKPCIEDTPVVQDLWKVSFEIDAHGKLVKASAPADPNVASCAQKILDTLEAPHVSGSVKVELQFAVPK